jgi:hypothetical protein
MDLYFANHHYPIDPEERCQGERIGDKGVHFLDGNFITTVL